MDSVRHMTVDSRGPVDHACGASFEWSSGQHRHIATNTTRAIDGQSSTNARCKSKVSAPVADDDVVLAPSPARRASSGGRRGQNLINTCSRALSSVKFEAGMGTVGLVARRWGRSLDARCPLHAHSDRRKAERAPLMRRMRQHLSVPLQCSEVPVADMLGGRLPRVLEREQRWYRMHHRHHVNLARRWDEGAPIQDVRLCVGSNDLARAPRSSRCPRCPRACGA